MQGKQEELWLVANTLKYKDSFNIKFSEEINNQLIQKVLHEAKLAGITLSENEQKATILATIKLNQNTPLDILDVVSKTLAFMLKEKDKQS